MKLVNRLKQPRYFILTLTLTALALITSVGLWRSTVHATAAARAAQKITDARRKAMLRADLRDGIGSEVKFSKPQDSAKDVRESVESLAAFAKGRSGIEFGEGIKERLTTLERETLAGKRARISVDELTEMLTDTALERASTLTDEEIAYSSNTLHEGGSNGGHVLLRASGKGFLKSQDFIAQAKTLRDQAALGNPLTRQMAKAAVAGEVNDRAQYLGEALPEQFGAVQTSGMTPLQATAITYSVASDDLLLFSQSKLQRLMDDENKSTAPRGVARSAQSGKAYGVNGNRFSTPLDLILNEKTMGSVLNRMDKLTNDKRRTDR